MVYQHIGIPTDAPQPHEGVRVAFVVENGAPVEFLLFIGADGDR